MASSDLLGGVLAFLEDDNLANPIIAGDLRNTINNDNSGTTDLVVDNSVVVTRRRPGGQRLPRRTNAPAVTVEIIEQLPGDPRHIGIGWVERDVVLDVVFTLRKKDVAQGRSQVVTAADVRRGIVNRYDGVTNLGITIPGGGAAVFCRSRAREIDVDDASDSAELIRAVVRLVFTFREAMATNE